MLDNCKYDKIKILHELSSLCWFIEKHCSKDANDCNDSECKKIYQEIKDHLEKCIEKVDKNL